KIKRPKLIVGPSVKKKKASDITIFGFVPVSESIYITYQREFSKVGFESAKGYKVQKDLKELLKEAIAEYLNKSRLKDLIQSPPERTSSEMHKEIMKLLNKYNLKCNIN
ncbi:hypothetical protein, partial [Cetobacterium sp.]|uniref:hypothetical protein n=1 Tax=Cetobacterium sp. TaxID=2071632 RepID=UPI003EE8139A